MISPLDLIGNWQCHKRWLIPNTYQCDQELTTCARRSLFSGGVEGWGWETHKILIVRAYLYHQLLARSRTYVLVTEHIYMQMYFIGDCLSRSGIWCVTVVLGAREEQLRQFSTFPFRREPKLGANINANIGQVTGKTAKRGPRADLCVAIAFP